MMKKYIFLKGNTLSGFLFCFTILSSFSAMCQTLNFTIDTAVDNGTSITESITSGGDIYVLTILHSGNEELFDLGAGDLMFYLSSGDPLDPYNLTITKNGNLTNFALIGIDYDTVDEGSVSVLNQDNAVISINTSYSFGAGAITITNPENASNITAFKIQLANSDDFNDFAFHNISIDILDTLSVDENILAENLTIFPNPSNGVITIRNNGIMLKTVNITDINGRTVERFDLNRIEANTVLDMRSKLSSGMYFMSISSEEGAITKKLIIE